MIKLKMLSLGMFASMAVTAQVSVTQLSVPYVQNFNSLSDTGTANPYSTLPTGWFAKEYGSGANTNYRASWGKSGGGDLHSLGDSASSERTLGSIGSGTVAPVIFGVALVNNTGNTVPHVRIKYTGEVWRVGNAARSTGPDSLHVTYGINNTDIISGTWNGAAFLNFISPVSPSSPTETALNGNASAQQVNIDDTLLNINLANNDTLWIRWMDYNSASFDDAMGVDDISITFLPPFTPPATMLSFTAFNTWYYQNFDSLAYTQGSLNSFATLPFGWFAKEYDDNADETYRAAYGDYSGGNTYSFGDTNSTERALGSLGSGTLTPSHYGAAWINNTGQVINNVEIKYTGEMWRLGNPARSTGADTLHFSYATHAVNIDSGNYARFPQLNFFSPLITGTSQSPVDGNLTAQQTKVSNVLYNLSLQQGDTLWIRWSDYDSPSFDDGLAIDSFAITPVATPVLLNIEFADSNTVVNEESGSVKIPLIIHNKTAFTSQVEVFIADTGNIDIANDLVISSAFVTFPGTKSDTVANFTFGIKNAEPFEADEYFVLGLRNTANAAIGQIRYDTIRIRNYQYPQVPIAALGADDTLGMPNSTGKNFVVEGIVHGVNYSATGGLDFYVLQNGAGINVYQPQAGSYQPKAGDKVKVWGQVGYFRGLTRLESLDSVQKISDNNTLETPKNVMNVTEAEEGSYLKIDSLVLYPALSKWPNNLEVYAVQAVTKDTIAIYVSANTDLAGEDAPKGYFSITGIGSQFNSSTNPPYDNGYRLMAASKSLVVPVSVKGIGYKEGSSLALYPNPFTTTLTVESSSEISEISVYTLDGKCIWKSNPAAVKATIPAAEWNAGVYILHTTDATGKSISKIVKL